MYHSLSVSEVSPSPLRIGAGSAVLAAHLALLLAMSLAEPEQSQPLQRVLPAAIQVDLITSPPVISAPPPPMPSAPARPMAQPQPAPPLVPLQDAPMHTVEVAGLPVDTDTSHVPAVVAGDTPDDLLAGGNAGLVVLQSPPPPYPARARRMGWQGEVVLRIHIGTDGWARDVTVLRGSGHADLDRAARRHVAQNWRFSAPLHEGRAVEAWGDVPIQFTLY